MIVDDLRRAFAAIEVESDRQWREPPVTVHHPRCRAVETGRSSDCNCGGAAFPR